jgi:hypothetical protein
MVNGLELIVLVRIGWGLRQSAPRQPCACRQAIVKAVVGARIMSGVDARTAIVHA